MKTEARFEGGASGRERVGKEAMKTEARFEGRASGRERVGESATKVEAGHQMGALGREKLGEKAKNGRDPAAHVSAARGAVAEAPNEKQAQGKAASQLQEDASVAVRSSADPERIAVDRDRADFDASKATLDTARESLAIEAWDSAGGFEIASIWKGDERCSAAKAERSGARIDADKGRGTKSDSALTHSRVSLALEDGTISAKPAALSQSSAALAREGGATSVKAAALSPNGSTLKQADTLVSGDTVKQIDTQVSDKIVTHSDTRASDLSSTQARSQVSGNTSKQAESQGLGKSSLQTESQVTDITLQSWRCKEGAKVDIIPPLRRGRDASTASQSEHQGTPSDEPRPYRKFKEWHSRLYGRCKSTELEPAELIPFMKFLKHLPLHNKEWAAEVAQMITPLVAWAAAANNLKRPVVLHALGTGFDAHPNLLTAVNANAEASRAMGALLRAAAADPDTYTSGPEISQMCSSQYKMRRYSAEFWERAGKIDLESVTGRVLGALVYAAAALPGLCDAPPPRPELWGACLRAMRQAAPQLDGQALSNCLWAIWTLENSAVVEADARDRDPAVDELISATARSAHRLDKVGVAACCWAIVGLNRELPMPLLRAIPHTARWMNPQSLANTMKAIAKAGLPPSKTLDAAVKALKLSAFNRISKMNAQDIAAMWWALAKLGHPPCGVLQRSLRWAVGCRETTMSPNSVANVLWAMARMGGKTIPQPAAIMRIVNATIPDMNSQDVANVLWALLRLPLSVQEGTRSRLLAVTERQATHFVPLEIVQVVQGLHGLKWEVPVACRAALCREVQHRARQFSPEELHMVLKLVAKLRWSVSASFRDEMEHAIAACDSSDISPKMKVTLQKLKVAV
jgi:hypothetical protein